MTHSIPAIWPEMQCCKPCTATPSPCQIDQDTDCHKGTIHSCKHQGPCACQTQPYPNNALQVTQTAYHKVKSFRGHDELTKEGEIDLCQVSIQQEPKEFACTATHNCCEYSIAMAEHACEQGQCEQLHWSADAMRPCVVQCTLRAASNLAFTHRCKPTLAMHQHTTNTCALHLRLAEQHSSLKA